MGRPSRRPATLKTGRWCLGGATGQEARGGGGPRGGRGVGPFTLTQRTDTSPHVRSPVTECSSLGCGRGPADRAHLEMAVPLNRAATLKRK